MELGSSERLKTEFATVMEAVYRSMRKYAQPGKQRGVSEVAELLELNEQVMRNSFGPTNYENAPTLYRFLQVLELLKSRDAVASIADLADCVTLPRRPSEVTLSRDLPSASGEVYAAVTDKLRVAAELLGRVRCTVAQRAYAREQLMDAAAQIAALMSRLEMPDGRH